MLGHRSHGHIVGFGQLADSRLALGQPGEDAAAGGVGESREASWTGDQSFRLGSGSDARSIGAGEEIDQHGGDRGGRGVVALAGERGVAGAGMVSRMRAGPALATA